MKKISNKLIRDTVANLCVEANRVLRSDVRSAIKAGARREKDAVGKKLFAILEETLRDARAQSLPICQDTGYPIVFVDIGRDILVDASLNKAVIEGVREGYRKGALRASIVDPIRRGTARTVPPIIHYDFVYQRGLTLTVLPKGFGSENKSAVKMFPPTVAWENIQEFIVSAVRNAGASACPPFFIGVGMGGTADTALLLSKKALLARFGAPIRDQRLQRFRKRLMQKINKLSFGIVGLPGAEACMGVNVKTAPTHIAGYPVGVSISCWVMRSASKTIL